MTRLTYTRAEWAGIADVLAATDRASVPPGLAERIDALLRETPAGWPDEPCVLELDAASAAAVQAVAAQSREHGNPLTEAEAIVREHQRDQRAATHRIEHRTQAGMVVVAHLSDVHTLHEELARHTARLLAAGETGELVLVAQASRSELARRKLWPEPRPEDHRSR